MHPDWDASFIGKLAPEEALDEHGHEHALDDDAHDGLGGRQPRLQRVQVELGEEHPPVDGVEADLQRVERLRHGQRCLTRHHVGGEEGSREYPDDEGVGDEDAPQAIAVAGQLCQQEREQVAADVALPS
jgi:hypothetical protein